MSSFIRQHNRFFKWRMLINENASNLLIHTEETARWECGHERKFQNANCFPRLIEVLRPTASKWSPLEAMGRKFPLKYRLSVDQEMRSAMWISYAILRTETQARNACVPPSGTGQISEDSSFPARRSYDRLRSSAEEQQINPRRCLFVDLLASTTFCRYRRIGRAL